jgi:hypothetical protein
MIHSSGGGWVSEVNHGSFNQNYHYIEFGKIIPFTSTMLVSGHGFLLQVVSSSAAIRAEARSAHPIDRSCRFAPITADMESCINIQYSVYRIFAAVPAGGPRASRPGRRAAV